MLRCFVEKVSNVMHSRYLVAFLKHIFELYVTFFGFFLALFGSFGSFTLFCSKVDLKNYFCSNLACVKKLSFCISGVIKHVEEPAINKVELLDL